MTRPDEDQLKELSRLHNELRELKALRRMTKETLMAPVQKQYADIEARVKIMYDNDISKTIESILKIRTAIKKPLDWSRRYKLER
jgi:hypothetical protein